MRTGFVSLLALVALVQASNAADVDHWRQSSKSNVQCAGFYAALGEFADESTGDLVTSYIRAGGLIAGTFSVASGPEMNKWFSESFDRWKKVMSESSFSKLDDDQYSVFFVR